MKIPTLTQKVEQLVKDASFVLRPDVVRLLQKAHVAHKGERGKQALAWIIENAEIAKRKGLAICQDTGLPVLFLEAGGDVRLDAKMIAVIEEAVAAGYKQHSLRASIVDPLKRGKPRYRGVVTYIEFVPKRKGLRVTLLPKGFGCENKSMLKMFNPTAVWKEIETFIVDVVKKAGPEACPPFVVGIGIGGTGDHALLLAKKALLQKLDASNADRSLAQLERRLLSRVNALGIGPMGLKGAVTALAVKIKTAPTHIAGLPVGVTISCHALRSASCVVSL